MEFWGMAHFLVIVMCLQVTEPSPPLRCISPCSRPPSAAIAEEPAASPIRHKNRKPAPRWGSTTARSFPDMFCLPSGEELIEDIKLVRDERKQLEWTRQELLRKGKDLLSQNRHRRNQGQWKCWFKKKKKFSKGVESPHKNRQCVHSTWQLEKEILWNQESHGTIRGKAERPTTTAGDVLQQTPAAAAG